MNGPIVSGSGIRGIFGRSLTPETASAYAAAFGLLSGPGRIAVGRDTRKSGPAMETAVTEGLLSSGCTPVPMGVFLPRPCSWKPCATDSQEG